MVVGRLGFNSANGRYGILVSDLWENDGLHCGEGLEWYDATKEEWVLDRIEAIYPADQPESWYLAVSGIKGRTLEGLKVRR